MQPSRIEESAPAHPPIGDFALIGDCRTAALVGRDGSIDWWCLPHFSGRSVFAALLDQRIGGRFRIRPVGSYRTKRRYLEAGAVLETRFETESGVVALTDAMIVANGRGIEPQCELLREVRALEGDVELEIAYEPRPDYALSRPRLMRCGALGWALEFGSELLLLNTDAALEHRRKEAALVGRLWLNAGARRFFSVTFVENDIGVVQPLGAAAEGRLDHTLAWWRGWSRRCSYDGPGRDAVLRSAVTLKLLTFSLSGAVVAAPTASLPETIGGERNWDYRYCWLRDASLTVEAFFDLGFAEEGAAFLEWLLHATRLTWPRLQVLYDVYGEARIAEEELDHLAGYRDSRPVRIGNGAWDQLQLDGYGAVIAAAASYVVRGGQLDMGEQRMLRGLGKALCRLWREPDHGLWEIRGPRRHYTHSKLMCWSGLDCLLRLDADGRLAVPRERFARERDALRRMMDRDCQRPENGYVGASDLDFADASLLLLPHYGYLRPDAPEMARTFERIDRDLTRGDALLLRYPPEVDGLEGEEHPFGICSFWAVEALAGLGHLEAARGRFDRLLGYANDVGLYAEEIAAGSGEAIGNFPQAFTHIGLIQAALALERCAQREQ